MKASPPQAHKHLNSAFICHPNQFSQQSLLLDQQTKKKWAKYKVMFYFNSTLGRIEVMAKMIIYFTFITITNNNNYFSKGGKNSNRSRK